MLKEFRDFIARGNVMDMAVGIIIGAAFTAIVSSMVEDLINPIIGLFTGGIDFTNQFLVLSGEVPRALPLFVEHVAHEVRDRALPLVSQNIAIEGPTRDYTHSASARAAIERLRATEDVIADALQI